VELIEKEEGWWLWCDGGVMVDNDNGGDGG